MTQGSPADLVVQKLRALIREKADQVPSGSPEHYRLQEMLGLSDDALFDTLYSSVESNPDRVGCPPRETLRELAMRTRALSDPLWDHVMECAPCRVEVREMGRDRPVTPVRSGTHWVWAVSAAAVLILAVAGMWIMLAGNRSTAPIVGQPSPGAVSADLTARIDLRPYTVARSDERRADPAPVVIPQGRVTATILLPVGAEPGEYEIRLLDQDLALRASSTGSASIRDFVTTLETTIDLRSIAPGRYQLGLRRSGGEWQLFPAQLQ